MFISEVEIIFPSRVFSHKKTRTKIGFSVSYQTVNDTPLWSFRLGMCGGNVTTPNGLLTSPLFPNNYQNDIECNYLISLQNTTTFIEIKFHDGFNISCHDELELWDGDSIDAPNMTKIRGNGNALPPFMLTSQNQLTIR